MKYVCDVCGWVYDEADGASDHGISPGTKWKMSPMILFAHSAA